jgi:hypothetical protein
MLNESPDAGFQIEDAGCRVNTGAGAVNVRRCPNMSGMSETAKNGLNGPETAFIFGRSAAFLGCGMGKYGVLFSIDK